MWVSLDLKKKNDKGNKVALWKSITQKVAETYFFSLSRQEIMDVNYKKVVSE